MRLTVAALFGFFLLFTLFPILFRAPLLVIPVVFALAVIMLYSGFVQGMDALERRCDAELHIGLVRLAGVHGDLIRAILQQAAGIGGGNGGNVGYHVSQRAIGGGVGYGIANLDILQLRKGSGGTPVVTSEADVARPAAGAVEVVCVTASLVG